MHPQLGLVCITDNETVRYRRMTKTRFLQLGHAGDSVQCEALYELYTDNLTRLNRAITFCIERRIGLYRVTSHLFPFSDEPAGREMVLSLEDEIRATGRRITHEKIRFVIHPDQFVVLNSDSPAVIENSKIILENHAFILDLLEQPSSTWATIILHGGKGNRAERLMEVTRNLPEPVRSRLAFENDERAYGADQILRICQEAGVPMIFDAHHHLVHARLESYEDPSIARFLAAARSTWADPAWQIVHISNGRTSLNDPRHSDLIHTMPSAFREAPWIEVEAKRKELAIEQLRAEWLMAPE